MIRAASQEVPELHRMGSGRNAVALWLQYFLEFPRSAKGGAVASNRLKQLAIEASAAGHEGLSARCLRRAADLAENPSGAYSEVGQRYYDRGDYPNALKAFQKAGDADLYSLQALRGIAMSLHMLERYKEATDYYLSVLTVDPGDLDNQLNLGLCYQAQGRLDDAIKQFRWALALDESDEFVSLALGRALYDRANFDEAVVTLKGAIELSPNFSDAYTYLGIAQDALGLSENALVSYRRALTLDPDDAYAHFNLAVLLIDRDDGNAVLHHARAALRGSAAIGSNEFKARALRILAWGHYMKREWAESATASRASLELDSTLAAVHLNLGLALLRGGRTQEARRSYEEAIPTVRDSWDVQEGIDDLEAALRELPELSAAKDILEQLRAIQTGLVEQARTVTA